MSVTPGTLLVMASGSGDRGWVCTRSRLLCLLWLGLLAGSGGCRVERVAPGQSGPAAGAAAAGSEATRPQGTLWVYTSLYPSVIDTLSPLVQEALPGVDVQWFKGGSEKVASRLDAELASGASQADVLVISDPFTYQRLAKEGRFLPYVSPHVLRAPRSMLDLDGHFLPSRLSTMVLAYREDVKEPPTSFQELTHPRFKGAVALGDPLLSGTAFTWAVFLEKKYGRAFFQALRDNEAVIAGGNAAVQQRIESGEAKAGFLLLENALIAKERGSPLRFAYPEDGAVVIPGHIAILKGSRNPVAAKAFVDLLLSAKGQKQMVEPGKMHSVDPRLPGPSGEPDLAGLLEESQEWTPELLERGVTHGADIKTAFRAAFAR